MPSQEETLHLQNHATQALHLIQSSQESNTIVIKMATLDQAVLIAESRKKPCVIIPNGHHCSKGIPQVHHAMQ
ncbi:hypothetical protein GBA52_008476 [Prunus armeniaca]|nr:hypothetical protein GBA52_008476 [Prunus armeniaca]